MKRNKGITLVALVITIIILLILAGITINLVVGNNGIIAKTIQAKQDYEREAVREEVTLLLVEYIQENTQNNKSLQSFLEEQVSKDKIESVEDNEDETHTIIINDCMVTIDDKTLEIIDLTKAKARPKISNIKIVVVNEVDGTQTEPKENELEIGTPLKIAFDVTFEEGVLTGVNIGSFVDGKVEYTTNGTETEISFEVIGKIGEEVVKVRKKVFLDKYYLKSEVGASDIKKNPTKYYGELVTNYICPSDGVEAWRIFYADENNIYLIADNYLHVDETPSTPQGKRLGTSYNDYTVKFGDIVKDTTYSKGSKWILENSKAKDWLKLYLTQNPESTNNNILTVAYLLDTNTWSTHFKGNNAEYAIGCPTIELFCKSFADTHPDYLVECEEIDENGYYVKSKMHEYNGYRTFTPYLAIANLEEKDHIYQELSVPIPNLLGYWLASPSAKSELDVMSNRRINEGVRIDPLTYNYTASFCGLKPIVCLNPEVQLRKTVDGFEII